jgi:hypothetical protein
MALRVSRCRLLGRFGDKVVRILIVVALFAGALSLFTVSHAQQDISPPVLVDLSFEPARVDTSDAAQTITVTAHITDDLSGLDSADIWMHRPGTTQVHLMGFYGDDLVDGDATDGYYQETFILPRFSAYGEWRIQSVGLKDNVGNLIGFNPSQDDWPEHFDNSTFINGPMVTPTPVVTPSPTPTLSPTAPPEDVNHIYLPLADQS